MTTIDDAARAYDLLRRFPEDAASIRCAFFGQCGDVPDSDIDTDWHQPAARDILRDCPHCDGTGSVEDFAGDHASPPESHICSCPAGDAVYHAHQARARSENEP